MYPTKYRMYLTKYRMYLDKIQTREEEEENVLFYHVSEGHLPCILPRKTAVFPNKFVFYFFMFFLQKELIIIINISYIN